MCECDENRNRFNLTCEIQNHTGVIIREGTVWVGVDTAENETDFYYLYQYCPNEYCQYLFTWHPLIHSAPQTVLECCVGDVITTTACN